MASRTASSKTTVSLIPVLAVRDAVHFPLLVNTLHVVREPSLRAIRKSMEGERRVLVLSQIDMSVEDPQAGDLCRMGTLSEPLQALPMPDTSLRVALRGISRARATKIVSRGGLFWAEIEDVPEQLVDDVDVEALMRATVETFTAVVQLNKNIPPEALQSVVHIDQAGHLADAIAHHLPIRPGAKQDVLEELDPRKRLDLALKLLKREQQVLDLNTRIHQEVERELGDSQREFYLREQLKIIQTELQEREDRLGETEEYQSLIDEANMPEEALTKATLELRRLDRTPAAAPEGMVLRNYLDCLVSLPWSVTTEDRLNVNEAAKLLDREHFGLDRVKNRILDFLAVRQLKGSLRGPILCFVGPPGVGKTSLGRSIAEAMGRRFVRISLGGIRDEAEIRGHRRTYVGSMPGRLIQGVRQCGARNPVFMLDELDKLGNDYRGDPTSALLEALDPEQNDHFSDHYLEVPFDLSAVMFIATANLIENVPHPLRDRMEIIPFPSYTDEERAQIARSFLFPKNLHEHGLTSAQVSVPEEAVQALVQSYTREAGVRGLQREIAAVCRKAARQIAEGSVKQVVIDEGVLQTYLGRARYKRNSSEAQDQVGAATGLVVSEVGGDVISIEASLMDPLGDRPELRLTGNLGDVMKESAQAALTYVRAAETRLNASRPFRYDVHIHVPEGGIPKDGPSAGVTIAVALASAYTGRAVRSDTAMTGEITLRGKVLPVGGIRDKVLAAHRAGIKRVIIPAENQADLDEVPPKVLEQLEIIAVEQLDDALTNALLQ